MMAMNRNQKRALEKRKHASVEGHVSKSLGDPDVSFDKSILSNFFAEFRHFSRTFALTPAQLIVACVGFLGSAAEVYKFVSGVSEPNVSHSAGSWILGGWANTTTGKILIFLLFSGFVSWACVLVTQLLTRSESEIRNIAAHIFTASTALFLYAWAHGLFFGFPNQTYFQR